MLLLPVSRIIYSFQEKTIQGWEDLIGKKGIVKRYNENKITAEIEEIYDFNCAKTKGKADLPDPVKSKPKSMPFLPQSY